MFLSFLYLHHYKDCNDIILALIAFCICLWCNVYFSKQFYLSFHSLDTCTFTLLTFGFILVLVVNEL